MCDFNQWNLWKEGFKRSLVCHLLEYYHKQGCDFWYFWWLHGKDLVILHIDIVSSLICIAIYQFVYLMIQPGWFDLFAAIKGLVWFVPFNQGFSQQQLDWVHTAQKSQQSETNASEIVTVFPAMPHFILQRHVSYWRAFCIPNPMKHLFYEVFPYQQQ